jgi:diguanylate cyclase (GGDEF)-like protein/PAS domain S-box-containing protein
VEPVSWSREEICELAQGRLVFQRDALALTVPLPGWLLAASAGEWLPGASETVERAHPDDRATLVGSYLAALSQPGVPQVVPIRQCVGSEWCAVEITWLNQLDNEDVAAQIGMILVLGPAEPPATDGGDAGQGATTNWLLVELDQAFTILSTRGPVESTLGYRPAELVGQTIASLLHPSALVDIVSDWMAILANPKEARVIRRPFVRADGTEIWFEASFLREDEHILAVLIDITDRLAREREMGQLTEQLSLLADAMPTALVRCDVGGTVLFHNNRWAELTDRRETGSRLHDIVADADSAKLDAALKEAFSVAPTERHSVEVRGSDAGAFWAVTLQPVGEPAADRIIMASVADATDTVRLRREARHDGLTGLLNRSAIEECVVAAVADGWSSGTLVVFVDLDRFKVVNDTFGHDAGDAVLRAVATRLRATVRPADDIGRFGGDEFVIVCRDLAPGAEDELVTRLAAALDEPVDVVGGQWHPHASVGCSRAQPGDDLATVMRRADLAMFEAKRARSVRG